jgi:hypothetical protein
LIQWNRTKRLTIYKLGTLLKDWKRYNPSEYDKVIKEALDIINDYGLKSGDESPSFSLPTVQLKEEFIIKFMNELKENGFTIVINSENVYTNMTIKKN